MHDKACGPNKQSILICTILNALFHLSAYRATIQFCLLRFRTESTLFRVVVFVPIVLISLLMLLFVRS